MQKYDCVGQKLIYSDFQAQISSFLTQLLIAKWLETLTACGTEKVYIFITVMWPGNTNHTDQIATVNNSLAQIFSSNLLLLYISCTSAGLTVRLVTKVRASYCYVS